MTVCTRVVRCVLACFAAVQLGCAAGASSATAEPAPDESAPRSLEQLAGAMTFDLSPDEMTAREIAGTVAELVFAAGPGADLSARDARELARVVEERVELLIEPDYDRWLEAARRSAPLTGGPADPRPRDRWERRARYLAGTPIASEGVALRRIDDTGEFPEHRVQPGTATLMSETAPYELPVGPGFRAVEALVPVRFLGGAGKLVPGMAGLQFARSDAMGWRPVAMYIYFFWKDSQGVPLAQPVF